MDDDFIIEAFIKKDKKAMSKEKPIKKIVQYGWHQKWIDKMNKEIKVGDLVVYCSPDCLPDLTYKSKNTHTVQSIFGDQAFLTGCIYSKHIRDLVRV